VRDIRYPLLDGDMTSTGGTLIAVCELQDLHHGKQVALEGNIATCPACKSSGLVLNDCFPNYSIAGKLCQYRQPSCSACWKNRID